MTWQQFRERANLYLFKNKERTLGIFKILSIVVTLLALSTMIWMYGFYLSEEEEKIAFGIIKISFGFYVIHYLTRIVYDFHPIKLIRKTWFEGLMMLLLVTEGVSYSLSNQLLIGRIFEGMGIHSYQGISTFIIQVYFFAVVITEFTRNSEIFPRLKLNPAVLFVLSFVFLIGTGTGLLLLPEMSVEGNISFVDALFTATSSACVTGLLTFDINSVLTFKGQFVVMMLIKLGGLNIISFGGFMALASKIGVGVRHHRSIEGFINRDNILSAKHMLRNVIIWTTSIESIGAVAMYYLWNPDMNWQNNGERVFYSLFHSISAFNNAGISLFQDGFYNEMVRYNYLIHWVVIILVFLGALGILAMFDLFGFKNLRERLKNPWKRIQFSTKIALYVSLWLIAIGGVLFYMLEKNGVLAGQSGFGKITGAVLQVVSPRTAGFNSVNFTMLRVPSTMIIIALMFIGASSSSTGGGIKTSSFAIIWADVKASMTGRKHAVLYQRSIGPGLKSNAYSIAIMYVVMNFTGTLLLSLTQPQILMTPGMSVLHLVFEQVSAFSTVGLSMGVTSLLNETGKYIIIGSMFVGRVGTFTIAFALAGRLVKENFKYPEAETLVG